MSNEKQRQVILNLITTALWKNLSSTEATLFLGEWCIPFHKSKDLTEVDWKVAPYHWEDRGKFKDDFERITRIYEETLSDLGVILSGIHKLDVGPKYWRIVIGPWLIHFISALWDRYHTVKFTLDRFSDEHLSTDLTQVDRNQYIPVSFPHFSDLVETDEWNKIIFDDLLRVLKPDICKETEELTQVSRLVEPKQFVQEPSKSSMKSTVHSVLTRLARRTTKHALLNSGMKIRDLVELNLSVGQLPLLRVIAKSHAFSPVDSDLRGKLQLRTGLTSPFVKFLNDQIKFNLPRIYLEDFAPIREYSLQLYPTNPKSIVTGYGFHKDDLFKVWAAEKTQHETSLAIFQHGGQFGMRLFDQIEDHQLVIADRFFSWGWSNSSSRVIPVSSYKLSVIDKKIKPKTGGKILVVCQPTPRYSGRLTAEPVGPQLKRYLHSQILFLDKLDHELRGRAVLRPYTGKDHWGFVEKMSDVGYRDLVCKSGESFHQQMKESQILVVTYNATTLLEALISNFPTLMFWDQEYRELNDQAKPWFESFRELGVFFESAEAAAFKVNQIYDDVTDWWHQEKIQSVRKEFCENFCKSSPRWKREWIKVITNSSW